MDLGLEQRVALVTGGSQGIGQATAMAFAREGARVAITYRHNKAKAERVVKDIIDRGGEGIAVPLDLADDDSIAAAIEVVMARYRRVDVLVNNAVEWGKRRPDSFTAFEDISPEEWRSILRSNVEGHFTVTQAVLPSMRSHKWGRIVNVSSGLAVNGIPGSSAYSAAKAALHGMTRALYRELAPAGIFVNVVMPGATMTDHIREVVSPAVLDQLAKASPLGRLPSPDEVAPTIVFLGSPANATVNGEIILSSGGHA